MTSGKLIRNNVAEHMRARGEHPSTHVADDAEYWQKLKEKLRQESGEYAVQEDPGELASLLEVIHAICAHTGITFEALEELRVRKAEEKGGFGGRIILDRTA